MPDKVTYYAVVNDLSSRDRPQACSGAPTPRPAAGGMKHSPEISSGNAARQLFSAERGDLENDFIEITEDEANQIVEQHPRQR